MAEEVNHSNEFLNTHAETAKLGSHLMDWPKSRAKPRELSDAIVFAICERFLQEEAQATAVAYWATDHFDVSFDRTQIYDCMREARRRGLIRLCPPMDVRLQRQIASWHGFDENMIQVVDLPDDPALRATDRDAVSEHVTMAAAEELLRHIKRIGCHKKVVRLAIGAGTTAMRITRKLAILLRSEEGIPGLALHALTPGIWPEKPSMSPEAYFAFFADLPFDVHYMALQAPAYVKPSEFESVKRMPHVARAFAAAEDIDIVVTSLASAHDPHGELSQFLRNSPVEGSRDVLDAHGYVGDVMYRPYGKQGPIHADTLYRAVTLFELEDLVCMAANRNKAVVLVAGPCGACGRCRTDALLPLLSSPELRVWSHLVLSKGTARELMKATAKLEKEHKRH